jgi:3',5'-nucleoside bisphosphate phosphatase
LNTFRSDLNVHTVLSPCAAVEMIPPLIVRMALEKGINLIAITDHNSTYNIGSVQKAAQDTDLKVLPGVELQTREEVHVLCLFDELSQTEEMQNIIDRHMPSLMNYPDIFGEQYVVDETGDYIRSEERLLSTSLSLTLKEAWESVERLGGIFIPAHINRQLFGLLPVLGFIPTDIPIEVLEISRHMTTKEAVSKFPFLAQYRLIQDGDVHHLNDFLGSTEWHLERPTIAELKLAIREKEGRTFKTKLVR